MRACRQPAKPMLSGDGLREWLDALGNAQEPDTRDVLLDALRQRTREAFEAGDKGLLYDSDSLAEAIEVSFSHARRVLYQLHRAKKIGRVWAKRRYRYYAE